MAACLGYQIGRSFLVHRPELIVWLKALKVSQDFTFEQRRRKERLWAELEPLP